MRVRSLGKRYKAKDFADIKILDRADGSSVLLGDVAKLTDGTNDNSVLIFHKQFPAVNLKKFVSFNMAYGFFKILFNIVFLSLRLPLTHPDPPIM